jgi:hypothetical protein
MVCARRFCAITTPPNGLDALNTIAGVKPAAGQNDGNGTGAEGGAAAANKRSLPAHDKHGINVFETTKDPGVEFTASGAVAESTAVAFGTGTVSAGAHAQRFCCAAAGEVIASNAVNERAKRNVDIMTVSLQHVRSVVRVGSQHVDDDECHIVLLRRGSGPPLVYLRKQFLRELTWRPRLVVANDFFQFAVAKELSPAVLDVDHAVGVQKKPLARMDGHRRNGIGTLLDHAQKKAVALDPIELSVRPPEQRRVSRR